MNIIAISEIGRAIGELKNGGIIDYPTDTVIGRGCNLWNYNSVKRIYQMKGKDFNEPLSFACSSIEEIKAYADISFREIDKIKQLLKSGSHYTFILKAKVKHPSIDIISRNKKIGIRIIDHPTVKMLTKYAGPIITTSANFHNEKAPKSIDELTKSEFAKSADLTISGKCYYGKPSIVYDLVDDRIIRD
jgi:L-threonylcarbamoyladenylate synthase